MSTQRPKPEIMSPAGYWPQLRAAIEAGADSVYFGLTHFTARAKVGFTLAELPEVMRTLHARAVRGFVTFNTLVFEDELGQAADAIAKIAEAGADALIIQDLGAMRMARAIAPDLELHASTQMTVTNADGVRLAQELGAKRVTLARELSLEEVRAINAEVDAELEIFVHGALCVAYSGQCFSSEAWGGRSANRGQCAQACRLPYELMVDGEVTPTGDARYLLSPGDLYTLEHVPAIVDAGVAALKIEGRYKDAEYVALATQAYRRAVDAAWADRPASPSAQERLQLESVYSRGLGPHFLSGTNHQEVVRGRSPRHRGVYMGEVVHVGGGAVRVRPSEAHRVAPLKPGDGVVLDAADWRSPQEDEEGGRVFAVEEQRDGTLLVRFGRDAIRPERVRSGDLLWRSDDPDVHKAAKPFLDANAPVHRRSVAVEADASEGQPLRTKWSLPERPAIVIYVDSDAPLGVGTSRVLDADLLREQFGRLGGTAFQLGSVDLRVSGRPFAPVSMLNAIRREAVDCLDSALRHTRMVRVHAPDAAALRSLRSTAVVSTAEPGNPQLHLLVRTPEQLDAALDARPDSITLDYLDLYGLKPSLERVQQSGVAVRVATPRVLKQGEEKISDFLLRLQTPLLVRSAGLLRRLQGSGCELTGDFSLNAANSLTADLLLDFGLHRLTPGHDLNAEQITQLASAAGAHRLEVIAWGHMPVFHTEHCVFCRFLSSGTTYKDCGRPCETHVVSLRDDRGHEHPVLADIGCRNTVFGGPAQDAGAHLQTWLAAGVHHYRLEFAHESRSEVTGITALFRRALSHKISRGEWKQQLRRFAPNGTTEGSLYVPTADARLPVLQ